MALPRSHSFSGGINNRGSISAGDTGIGIFDVGLFADGIKNTGKVTAGSSGILVVDVVTFAGGRKQHRHDLGTQQRHRHSRR